MTPITPIPPSEEFLRAAEQFGIAFEADELEKCGQYLACLREANQVMNLTRIVESDVAWMRHILDSLTLLPFLVEGNAMRVVDVGSGGGTPGLPLAIACSGVNFTLLEATGKKAAFLKRTAEVLGLKNVEVLQDRAESAGSVGSAWRESFDMATARALGPMPVLLELTVPLVRVGGHVLAIKGERASEEIAEARTALHELHCEIAAVHGTPTGKVVVVEKLRATPKKFPRSPGEPKRAPIGSAHP